MTISAPVMSRAMSFTPTLIRRIGEAPPPWKRPRRKSREPRGRERTGQRQSNDQQVSGVFYFHLLRVDRSPRNHISARPRKLPLHVLPRLGFGECRSRVEANLSGEMREQRPHAQRVHGRQLGRQLEFAQERGFPEGAWAEHPVKPRIAWPGEAGAV